MIQIIGLKVINRLRREKNVPFQEETIYVRVLLEWNSFRLLKEWEEKKIKCSKDLQNVTIHEKKKTTDLIENVPQQNMNFVFSNEFLLC